ncbi:MAG: hypothetical protein K2G93_06485 [Rikenella sp.]|nr:hypothetical protein [Rikenella sp.]
MYSIGRGGYGWTSTVTGSGAYFHSFGFDWVIPNSSSPHAHGLPLRCLLE